MFSALAEETAFVETTLHKQQQKRKMLYYLYFALSE